MSYTNVITGGSSVERVGNPSFDDQLADLQEQIDEGGGGGSVPTGTGLRHVTDGVEDGTAYSLSAADIPEHSADKLTSGTIPAARLPGVLANVDTQAELLSAAAAAAASHAHVQADLPAQLYLEAQLSSQTLLSLAVHPGAALTCATPTHNDCFTYSSGTWTATVAGWYEIAAYIYKYPYTGNSQINFKKNGSLYSGGDFLGSAGSILGTGAQTMMYLGVGDTFAACGVVSANIALDVSNLYYAFVRAFWRGR